MSRLKIRLEASQSKNNGYSNWSPCSESVYDNDNFFFGSFSTCICYNIYKVATLQQSISAIVVTEVIEVQCNIACIITEVDNGRQLFFIDFSLLPTVSWKKESAGNICVLTKHPLVPLPLRLYETKKCYQNERSRYVLLN